MKVAVIMASMALLTLLSGAAPVVHAQPASSERVFVAKDTTGSSTITYRDYARGGKLLWVRTIQAPPDSFIEITVTTLGKAKARHEPYVVDRGSSTQQGAEVKTLHRDLLRTAVARDRAAGVSPTAVPQISCNTSATATGQFRTYHNAYADYQISYNKYGAGCGINVTQYKIWLSNTPSSPIYFNWINWAGNGYVANCLRLGVTETNADVVPLYWSGGSGYQFTSDVNDCNSCNYFCGTDYQGYITLQ